jgi:TetR/AcrR family transcriptional regulator
MTTAVVEAGASREKILEAAETLFARRGYAAVGMREVAEAAGLGKSSLFHHFRSKAELYAAVVGRILVLCEARLCIALAGDKDPLIRFDRWLDALVDTLAGHPTAARLLLRSLFEDDELTGASEEEQRVDETLKRMFAAAGDLLREGEAAGVFRAVDVAHTLQSLIGLTVYHFASGDFGAELLGESLFSANQVRKRKDEVRAVLHAGLLAQRRAQREPPSPNGGMSHDEYA